jgi:hypothetical protein
MYLLLDDQLDMTAATSGEHGSTQLTRAVQHYLDAQAAAPAQTQTGESERALETTWPAELGDYRPLLLSHEHARGLVMTGVVVLVRPIPGFAYPARLLAALSLFWAGTGEVSTLLAANENPPER